MTEPMEKTEKTGAGSGTKPKNPLLDDYTDEIFKIKTLFGSGTAIRSPDGRLVTSYSLIKDSSEIIAEQNGKRYRVGKNMKVDDINDLVVLDFVDAPPRSKKPIVLSGRSLDVGENVSILSKEELGTRSIHATFGRKIKQENCPIKSESASFEFTPENLQDTNQFANRSLLQLETSQETGQCGDPVYRKGELLGIVTQVDGKKSFAIPAEAVKNLLDQSPSKFLVTTGYESGVGKTLRDLRRSPLEGGASMLGALPMLLSHAGMTSSLRHASFIVIPTGLLTLARARDEYQDFKGSTNLRDSIYYGSALTFDSINLAGLSLFEVSLFAPRLRPLSIGIATVGMVGRFGCEFIPNRYVVKDITRSDGDKRPPFTPPSRSFFSGWW